MTDERLEWFPCYPAKLLGALAGMKAPEGYVYTIVLLRIYESGGVCRDTLDALATRTRLNRRIVSEALDSLFRAGRLVRDWDGITNPVAVEVIADSKALREERQRAGSKGGKLSAQKRQIKQPEGPSKASGLLQQSSTPLPLHKQDSLFPNGNRPPEAKASGAMKDPPLDPEADLYRRGKEVLGANAGGLIRRLLTAKGGNVALARAAVEQASQRGDAREYVGAMVRNNGGSDGATRNGTGKGGFSSIAARIRFGEPGPDRPAPEDLEPLNRR